MILDLSGENAEETNGIFFYFGPIIFLTAAYQPLLLYFP